MSLALFQGMVIGAGMIMPLGVQNSYVLNQGIKRNHHFLSATVCMLCDIFLIGLGVFGGGKLIASNDMLMLIMGGGGMIFLLVYGGMSFKRVWLNQYQPSEKPEQLTTKKAVVATSLAVTLLNPHVYLDTVMILGSVAGTFEGQEKHYFTLGTMLASVIWFYSLAGGAAKLAPWLSKPNVQRGIDTLVGSLMIFVAYSLFKSITA